MNERALYEVATTRSSHYSGEAHGYRYGLIRSISHRTVMRPVYNLEVEEDNSYTADGVIVHNCQGHSTAGKRGGLDDPRNQLIRTYLRFVEDIRPDGFLMENVLGLRTSAGGGFLKEVLDKTANLGYEVACHELDASRYAIPQRRKRVFACGFLGRAWPRPPEPFSLESRVSVSDALGDLPPLKAGEDGTQLDYTSPAFTPYQAFCRGEIDAGGYLDATGFGSCP